MPRILKTLEYRRANWLSDANNLEQLIRSAWDQFDTQLERTISRGANRAITGLKSRDFGQMGFALHCARYTNGQSIGTVPMAPQASAEVGERPPEANENFMNADFMALIKDNHVIVMNCGRNAGALRDFLTKLFEKANFADNTQMLDLARIGNLDKLAMIETVGVGTIDMDINISDAAANEIIGLEDQGIWSKATSRFSNAIHAITAQDESIAQLRLAEQGRVRVSINVQKRDLEVAKSGLDSLAEAIADDDEADNFVIHLRNGQTIRADEVTVKKQVRLQEVANSVSVIEAWDEMASYYSELSDSGQIEA
ncbi:hypothetical protein [Lentilitoribacter sp. EG35]|uniref:hypothetical protein n=1 Tax=Lentilitoribacter sp. EG35 TaxID=3234192 RepID=UPI00345F468E